VSKYEDKLARIADLKKQAETERKNEVIKIFEKYCGKIKDLQLFERSLIFNSDIIRQALKGEEIDLSAPVSVPLDATAENQLLVGKMVEEIACKITDIDAWREYLRQYQGYIRKTQGKA